MKGLAAFIVLVAVAISGWWFVSRKTGTVISPTQVLKAKTTRISHSETVVPGKSLVWTLSAPDGKTPGLLQGRWTSSGKSASIKGAKDDSLVGFILRGPDNRVLDKLDHPTSGNFNVRFETPGSVTFTFDNSGIIRSSARNIQIEGTYQPD